MVNLKKKRKTKKKTQNKKAKKKIRVVMEEFKEGTLRSGNKKGPRVTNPKQAIAIAISESKKTAKNKKKTRKKKTIKKKK